MPQRDSLEVDVLFVGGGPASLAGAIRLQQLAKAASVELAVMVIEKGGEIGNHGFSGAVVDPKALHELFPNEDVTGGLDTPVSSDAMWFLTNGGKIKELWKVPGRLAAGSVIHTLGAPLWNTFGGGWIYAMSDDIIDIGLVTGLDYADPTTDPHDNFQRYKLHPAIRPLLEGGEMIRYGAKAIPEGGLHAMPRFYADGLCIVGDSAGFLNGLRLKGIHLAMKSGMMAAEAIFDALQADDTSSAKLSAYETKFQDSWARKELHAARNFHQGFGSGMWGGLINAQLSL